MISIEQQISSLLAILDGELEKAAANALDIKQRSTKEEWSRRRAGATKRIYNLMERRNALVWIRNYPDAVYLYDAKVVGFTSEEPIIRPKRVYDALQIKGDFAQPVEMKDAMRKLVELWMMPAPILAAQAVRSWLDPRLPRDKTMATVQLAGSGVDNPLVFTRALVHAQGRLAQAQVRQRELDNLRYTARLLPGEREDDPEIERKIVVEGGATSVIVTLGDQ